MTVTPKTLGLLEADTTEQELYAPAAGVIGIMHTFTVCNTTGSTKTFALYKVPNGGAPPDGTIFTDIVLEAAGASGSTFVDRSTRVIDALSSLVVFGSAAGVWFHADGAEQTP